MVQVLTSRAGILLLNLHFVWVFFRKDDIKDIDSEKEAAMEAEIKAARERAIVPLEARMKQFKDMLLERGVRNLCVCEEGEREVQITNVCVCVREGREGGSCRGVSSWRIPTLQRFVYGNNLILPLINEWSWYKTPDFKETYNYSKALISV